MPSSESTLVRAELRTGREPQCYGSRGTTECNTQEHVPLDRSRRRWIGALGCDLKRNTSSLWVRARPLACACRGVAAHARIRRYLRTAVTRATSLSESFVPAVNHYAGKMMMACFSVLGPSGIVTTLRQETPEGGPTADGRRPPSFRSACAAADLPSAGPDDEDDETDEREDRRDDTARDDDGHRSTVEEPTPDRVDAPFHRTTPKKGGVQDPDRSR